LIKDIGIFNCQILEFTEFFYIKGRNFSYVVGFSDFLEVEAKQPCRILDYAMLCCRISELIEDVRIFKCRILETTEFFYINRMSDSWN
jgi:hypothetical protein